MLIVTEASVREAAAKHESPKEPLTRFTYWFVIMTTNILSVVLIPIQVVTTFLSGLLYRLTGGLFGLVYGIFWWFFLAALLLMSWAWLRLWPTRPLLLLPGVFVAWAAHIYLTLVSEPQRGAKYWKLTLVDNWPLTWYVFKPPNQAVIDQYYRDQLS